MKWTVVGLVAAAGLIASQFISIFVVQPLGAIPDGVTAIITRPSGLNFIDSPDAFCERKMGGVNIICRGAVAARVVDQSTILLRLPYSSTLYQWSTGGKTYDR